MQCVVVARLLPVPTDAVVIVLSMVLKVLAYFGSISYFARAFVWYELVLAIVGSFIVAFVSMFGWEKLTTLWNRFKQ